MNNSSKLYRTTAWAIYFSLSLLTLSLSSCDYFAPNPFVTWKEEVKINDGRTIVVEQKKRVGGLIAREAWLSINLPDLDIHNIVWHEHLMPLVVNIDQGKLYVIGFPPSVAEYREYDKPHPMYIGFLWSGGAWTRLSFDEIPKSIYDANMYLEGLPPTGKDFVSLEDKQFQKSHGNYASWLKKLDRNSPVVEN